MANDVWDTLSKLGETYLGVRKYANAKKQQDFENSQKIGGTFVPNTGEVLPGVKPNQVPAKTPGLFGTGLFAQERSPGVEIQSEEERNLHILKTQEQLKSAPEDFVKTLATFNQDKTVNFGNFLLKWGQYQQAYSDEHEGRALPMNAAAEDLLTANMTMILKRQSITNTSESTKARLAIAAANVKAAEKKFANDMQFKADSLEYASANATLKNPWATEDQMARANEVISTWANKYYDIANLTPLEVNKKAALVKELRNAPPSMRTYDSIIQYLKTKEGQQYLSGTSFTPEGIANRLLVNGELD